MSTTFEFKSSQVDFTSSGNGVTDVSLPTFAGLTSVTPNNDGSFTLNWSAASGTKTPIYFDVYVVLGTQTFANTFLPANFTRPSKPLVTSDKVFLMPDRVTYFVKGQTYTFCVKARDAFGYVDNNTVVVSSTAIASGNLAAVYQSMFDQIAATEVLLAQDHVNLNQDHLNIAGDHTNLAADHVNFQSDHSNFQSDHTALQGDHTNLNQDHLDLNQDHLNIAGDHTNLQSDHSNFLTDHSNFQSDHTNFVADDAAYDVNNATLAAEIAALASVSGGLTASLAPSKLRVQIKSQSKIKVGIKGD